jgi:hypothetical protein
MPHPLGADRASAYVIGGTSWLGYPSPMSSFSMRVLWTA